MTVIVFSKNRACQLELLLRSLNVSVTVIYTCDPEFEGGYYELMYMYPDSTYIRQDNLKEQVLKNIAGTEYVLFLVDDDVMIEHFHENCPEFTEFKNNPDIICLNLRMSPQYRRDNVPVLINNTWEWNPYRYGKNKTHWSVRTRNWGYPMSVSSHIFRSEDIYPIIRDRDENISTPHRLERALNRNPLFNRPLMLCFDKAKIINNLANQVQTVYPYPNHGVSVLALEKRFMGGERLSLRHMQDKAVTATDCFLMTDYEWERP
jgi:hypothetical protein